MQLRVHIKVILFGFHAVIKQSRQFLFIKAGEQRVKVHALQRLNLHPQKLLIPSGVHRHAVVRNDVGFLLRLGEVVGKDTRNFLDAFFFGSKNTSVSGDYIEIPVNDNGIDKSKLPEGRAELGDLLRGVGAGIVHIGYQFGDWHQLHFVVVFIAPAPIPQISQSRQGTG